MEESDAADLSYKMQSFTESSQQRPGVAEEAFMITEEPGKVAPPITRKDHMATLGDESTYVMVGIASLFCNSGVSNKCLSQPAPASHPRRPSKYTAKSRFYEP